MFETFTGFSEDQFINGLKAKFADIPSPPETLGIGDDAAVFSAVARDHFCISTDSLVENIHFRREWITPKDLGFKSLAVNLSDLAAMNARPFGFFLNLSFPKSTSTDWLTEYISGLHEIAKKFQIPLLGGDTTGSDRDIFISISVLGIQDREKIKLRSGGKPKDLVFVAGMLGDSAAGLDSIKKNRPQETLVQKHFRPEPQLQEAAFLSQFPQVHSLMDLSDGLLQDLPRFAQSSQYGFQIYADRTPLSLSLKEYCQTYSEDPLKFALAGGEDYVLLGTCSEPFAQELFNRFHKEFYRPLYFIGELLEEKKEVWRKGPEVWTPNFRSFNHWANAD